MDDVQEMKPTMFCGVPRVYDRIYTGINQKISSGGLLAKKIFQYAYDYKLKNLQRGYKQDEASPFFDKLVFDNIKQGLGGRIRIMLSGAAPLPRHVEDFRRITTCGTLVQGYGDIGEWQPDGAMKIIDRKKNIFKLSEGEYIAVENIESIYAQCPLITWIWVYGNSFESFLVGVVIPEKKSLENWATSNNFIGNFEELCKQPQARKYIVDELNKAGRGLGRR